MALVVDDDRETREMYISFLSAAGVNTVDAQDGVHGLAKAAAFMPDVITTDLRLPRMDGVTLCRSLKERDYTQRIPVIAVTGSASAEEIDAARRAGCVSVLLKPCSPETLLGEISRVLAMPHPADGAVAPVIANHPANRLLAALPVADYVRLMPQLAQRQMSAKQVLQKAGTRLEEVLFPERGVCSLIQRMDDGASVEVGMIGPEGVVGIGAVLGDSVAFGDVVASTPGTVYALNVDAFRREMDRQGSFRDVVMQYGRSFLQLSAQSAACNGLHPAYQRVCRWLLASSCRLQSDEIPLTHEMLSMMLGFRRPTVTLAFQQLLQDGLIRHSRGKARIVNRPALEAAACECYALEKRVCS